MSELRGFLVTYANGSSPHTPGQVTLSGSIEDAALRRGLELQPALSERRRRRARPPSNPTPISKKLEGSGTACSGSA